jgi:hypothetical protein
MICCSARLSSVSVGSAAVAKRLANLAAAPIAGDSKHLAVALSPVGRSARQQPQRTEPAAPVRES